MKRDLKVAIIHDWLCYPAGSEKVVEVFCELFPKADIFTLVYQKEFYENSIISRHNITESFISELPFGRKLYKICPFFYPIAIEEFDLSKYDFILSSSHAVAHGVIKHPGQIHICYKHTPIRYAWDMYWEYKNDPSVKGKIKKIVVSLTMHYMRLWDYNAAQKVDYFLANSNFVKERIKTYYNRNAKVVFGPVDTKIFFPTKEISKENYYITYGRIVWYKRFDIIVEAFKKMPDKKLLVIGEGPEKRHIQRLSRSAKNIEILGRLENKELVACLQKAKGFIFAAVEDFGLTPIEAQAAGTPVIAYGKGGALETIIDGKTGIFFYKQTPDSLIKAVKRFEKMSFKKEDLLNNASRFSKEKFEKRIKDYIKNILSKHI